MLVLKSKIVSNLPYETSAGHLPSKAEGKKNEYTNTKM